MERWVGAGLVGMMTLSSRVKNSLEPFADFAAEYWFGFVAVVAVVEMLNYFEIEHLLEDKLLCMLKPGENCNQESYFGHNSKMMQNWAMKLQQSWTLAEKLMLQ